METVSLYCDRLVLVSIFSLFLYSFVYLYHFVNMFLIIFRLFCVFSGASITLETGPPTLRVIVSYSVG